MLNIWRGIVGYRAMPARNCALTVAAGLGLAALAAGCSSTISTPLPEIRPEASTSLTEQERKRAVDELTRKRMTHEQEAEQAIEEAR